MTGAGGQPAAGPAGDACVACGGRLEGASVGTEQGAYHAACFRCELCQSQIADGVSFRFKDGKPYHGDCHKARSFRSVVAPRDVEALLCAESDCASVRQVRATRVRQAVQRQGQAVPPRLLLLLPLQEVAGRR
jgi:hypothetical protein